MIKRRTFLKASLPLMALAAARHPIPELRINRIIVQTVKGRRLTPVAPNAYAPYRGYDINEPIVRIQTAQGLEGIGRAAAKPDTLKALLGRDPFALFRWEGDRIAGPADEHKDLLAQLYGSDMAVLDLLGKTLKRPVADVLGPRRRENVRVYDSSLYMEDLLKPSELEGVAYLKAGSDLVERVARKALWVLGQSEGIRILKIKIGRAKWMDSFDAALARDIAVVKAIRRLVGPDITLFVDGNDGYKSQPLAAAQFAEDAANAKVYAMEEMFPETHIDELHEVKRRMRNAGLLTKLADGENNRDGIPLKICAEVFRGAKADEPLFDIEQADMNANGYLRMQAIARERARFRMTVAPHNFGSKLGFWSQVHLGLVTPNWEFCETDDSQFPALRAEGIQIKNGLATLTGASGLGVQLDQTKLEKPSTVIE